MKQLNEEKLKRFANDSEMNEAVKEVLLTTFLKKIPNADVNILASQTIAINLLLEAWREIDEYILENEEDKQERRQIGI